MTRGTVLAVASLAAVLFMNGSAAARHCVKGKPCGKSCIARDKTCTIPTPAETPTVRRDKHGRIERSSSVRRAFLRSNGLAHTPAGCQVDHIVPLAKGGPDTTSNMQLLCGRALREKERTELR
jgi:5-methylcytosine-specific restriction endonuclease McrA